MRIVDNNANAYFAILQCDRCGIGFTTPYPMRAQAFRDEHRGHDPARHPYKPKRR